MNVIGVVSMKGGVGKTTTTANLAAALATRLGLGRVMVVDLDPQNALAWHFGIDASDTAGICRRAFDPSGGLGMITGKGGLRCVPYGAATEQERQAFEALLHEEPGWMAAQLERSCLSEGSVVLIDTPPGHSVYLRQVFDCADIIIPVLLADPASYATVSEMETSLQALSARRPGVQSVYLVNEVDEAQPLHRDVVEVLRNELGARLAPVQVHFDEAVSEALAFQQPVLEYDPHGQASHEMDRLASFIIGNANQ